MNKFTINYKEVERLIKKEYDIDFSFIRDQEMANNSFRTYDVGKGWFEDFNLEREIKGRRTRNAHSFMQALCESGAIEDGEYTVLVSW